MLSKNQIKLIKSLESKKFRKREGLFVAEGPKVVGDLLRAGYQPHSIFATPQCSLSNIPCSTSNIQLSTITDDELHRISFLQHPQEVLAIFHIPTPLNSSNLHLPSDICLALDGVQDPGNVGTIIRIADWFGINHIFCSLDTADIYNPKVVQATMGSLAHISVTYCDLVPLLRKATVPIYGTLLDGQDIYQQPLSREGIIVMGNEGNGISSEVRQLITNKLLIPNFNKNSETAESLNVAIATAITCSEFRRRF
jgi:TrmH family RNA methyltransferase